MLELRAMDMTPKSPEPESETPTRIQPAKPISFSNGIIKRHNHHHHPLTVTYKDCLKNHAAAIGGHALDGCGEFMPSPSSTPSDPTSFKCAACGCHRNFHRRDPDDSSLISSVNPPSLPPSSTTTAAIEYQPHHRHHPPPPLAPPQPHLNFAAANNHISTTPGSRKRFRTKFSSNQKEKMHKFADRIGWKIQKRDEDEVRDFCRQIGVDKGVLKVWMHNNKNTFRFSGGSAAVQRNDNGINVSGGENNIHNGDDVGGVHGGGNELGGGRLESDSGGGNVNASSSSS
ncbi:Zinc-finger homeodomain protein 9 [Cardamine amara subsp. amara]|uniref:Zinc-finger homeodomain protein 9 n=1 Tax=Cardamine amara subsp. amara TaxID=228776 RepID=A0ABD1AM34_CARAN